MIRLLALVLFLLLSGCIGTDFLDVPKVSEVLEITPDRIAVRVGSTFQASSTYLNRFGVIEDVPIEWSTNPSSVAGVDQNGLVTGISAGQALLFASYDKLVDTVRVTVVKDDVNSVATVNIMTPKTTLSAGETIVLSVEIKNIIGMSIAGDMINWSSGNENVLTVSMDGTVTAVGNGKTTVVAEVDGILSNIIELEVSGDLSGVFTGAGGYSASGTVTLKEINSKIILELNSDFTTEFALGTFIYLANNNTSGSAVISKGIELGEITQNGGKTFNVTETFPTVTLLQYKYVIILCKPAKIVFGFATLN